MTSDVKPIHQLGGSTLVTKGSFPALSSAGAALAEGKRISAQHKLKSRRVNKRPVIEVQNFFTPEE